MNTFHHIAIQYLTYLIFNKHKLKNQQTLLMPPNTMQDTIILKTQTMHSPCPYTRELLYLTTNICNI